MRHIGRKRDFPEGFRLIRPRNAEFAISERNIPLRRLQHMRCDLLALGDDLVHRLHHRRAADGKGP